MHGSAVFLRVANPGPANFFQVLVEIVDAELLLVPAVNPFHARWGFASYWGSEALEPREQRLELVRGDAGVAMIATLDPIESPIYPAEVRREPSFRGMMIVRLYFVEESDWGGFVDQAVAVPAEIHMRISVLGQSGSPVTDLFVLKLGQSPQDCSFTKAP